MVKKSALSGGRGLLRLLALSFVTALLVLPLAPRAAQGATKLPNTIACKAPELRAKYGSYENCVASTPDTIPVSPGIFSLTDRIEKYKQIREDFLSLPRAKDFVLAADDCEAEKRLRRKNEGDISKLYDLRDGISVILMAAEVEMAKEDAKAITGGRLTTEQAWKSSEIHESLAKIRDLIGSIDNLIGNMQATDIENRCGTPEDNSGWTAVDLGTRFTPSGGGTRSTSGVKGTEKAPGEEGSPYGEPGRTTESGLPTADTRCPPGAYLGKDNYGNTACVCSKERPVWSDNLRRCLSPQEVVANTTCPDSSMTKEYAGADKVLCHCPSGMVLDGSRRCVAPAQTISCSGGAVPARDQSGQLGCYCPTDYPVWNGSQCVSEARTGTAGEGGYGDLGKHLRGITEHAQPLGR